MLSKKLVAAALACVSACAMGAGTLDICEARSEGAKWAQERRLRSVPMQVLSDAVRGSGAVLAILLDIPEDWDAITDGMESAYEFEPDTPAEKVRDVVFQHCARSTA